jgi:hypothetical protein
MYGGFGRRRVNVGRYQYLAGSELKRQCSFLNVADAFLILSSIELNLVRRHERCKTSTRELM